MSMQRGVGSSGRDAGGDVPHDGARERDGARRPPAGSPDVKVWTGYAAMAVGLLLLVEFSAQMVAGTRPPLDAGQALAEYTEATSRLTLIVILTDTFLMAFLIVFLAGFRQIITHARADLQWLADLAFGAGLVFVAITLVGDAMEGGAALDVIGVQPDDTVIRALTEGHMVLFGSVGCVLTALVAAASGHVTIVSGALPRWTGVLAYVVAVLNLIAVWTIFGGTDVTSIHSVGGWGTALFATFPWLVWVVSVGVVSFGGRRSTRVAHV